MKKKNLLLALLVLMSAVSANSQDPTFEKGNKVFNLGIGFGNVLYSGIGYKTSVPPLSISGEYGVVDGIGGKGSIGVGAYLGYSASKWEDSYYGTTWGYKYSNLIIAARGTFHYPLIDKLDTYAGVMIGANIASSSTYGNAYLGYIGTTSSAGGGGLFSFLVGARYYLTPNFAGMLELGYGISYINLGIALKIH